MSRNARIFRELYVEVLIPTILYVLIAPTFMNDVWISVKADPTTPWTTYAEMHALAIGIGVCWVQCYNCVRQGLFPRKPTR